MGIKEELSGSGKGLAKSGARGTGGPRKSWETAGIVSSQNQTQKVRAEMGLDVTGNEVPEGSHSGPCLSSLVSLVNSGGDVLLRVMPELTAARCCNFF